MIFFSAALTTPAPPTTVRPDARRRARPDVTPDPTQKPISQTLFLGGAISLQKPFLEIKKNSFHEFLLFWLGRKAPETLLLERRCFSILAEGAKPPDSSLNEFRWGAATTRTFREFFPCNGASILFHIGNVS